MKGLNHREKEQSKTLSFLVNGIFPQTKLLHINFSLIFTLRSLTKLRQNLHHHLITHLVFQGRFLATSMDKKWHHLMSMSKTMTVSSLWELHYSNRPSSDDSFCHMYVCPGAGPSPLSNSGTKVLFQLKMVPAEVKEGHSGRTCPLLSLSLMQSKDTTSAGPYACHRRAPLLRAR